MESDYRAQAMEGGSKSGSKNDDDRCVPRRPRCIQCFNCGLMGHTCDSCPRGQGRNLTG